MITKNFKMLLAMILLSAGTSKGYVKVKNTAGNDRYIASYFSSAFPTQFLQTVQVNSNVSATGIHLGTGTTQPTENDYALESRLVTGLTAQTPTKISEIDASGNPYVEFLFTVTNTTASDIVVSEIAYYQQSQCSTSVGGNASANTLMLDRTVLASPVTVPANDSVAIKYTLKTVLPT